MNDATDGMEIIEQMTGDDDELRQMLLEESCNAEVAGMVYDARDAANLTQAALADLIGTKQPVIARLEDADYEGHSLSMLKRIAKALDLRLELRFLPLTAGAPASECRAGGASSKIPTKPGN